MSSQITFAQVSADEARMYQDGEHVGDVYRQPADILMDGAVFYLVHLSEDPRGPARVHDRARIREVAEHRLRTHPLLA